MPRFDWIVVGNGLAGAALSYELACQGFTVLLLDQSSTPESATRLSYGGVPYWAGTTPLTTQLCEEGIAKQRQLPLELEADTGFQDLDLLLTIPAGADPAALTREHAKFALPPRLVSTATAMELEPLLNPEAIAGALVFPHARVSPEALIKAYNQAFLRRGGTLIIAPVLQIVRVKHRVTGITTPTQAYAAGQVAIAAGAYSRVLLHQAQDSLWDQPGHTITPPILDSGAVQFSDRRLRIGQISRTLTSLDAPIDPTHSEQQLRQAIGRILPLLQEVPGRWHRCLVAFSRDSLPLVGPLPGLEGLSLFTGFSSPFVLLPPIAERLARAQAAGQADPLLTAMEPQRFSEARVRQTVPEPT